MGGKGVPGGEGLANFANSLIGEGQGTRRETQRRSNEAMQFGTVSRGAKPLLDQKLTEAFSAISQGLTKQRGQLIQAGQGRSSAALGQMGNSVQQGFLEASKIPTNYAQQVANQGASASYGSVPTIMSGFEARNQLGLSGQLGAFSNVNNASSGIADIINNYAQIRSNRYVPPEIPTPEIAGPPSPY